MANYGVVLVTVNARSTAKAVAETLVRERLAACVNLFPVHSVYTWQGNVEQEEEWQLLIKTDLEAFEHLASRLQAIHPYEVPEILALPIQAGSSSYLNWMAEQLDTTSSSRQSS